MKIKLILILSILTTLISAKDVYFKHVSREQGLSQLSAISIWQDNRGFMWFGNSALNKYNGNSVETFRLSNYTAWGEDNNVRSICGDKEDGMYILANKEIISYDLKKEKFRQLGIQASTICFAENTLYYADSNRLSAFNPVDSSTTVLFTFPQYDCYIRTLIPFDNNHLLAGTSYGVYKINIHNKSNWLLYESTAVSCLFIDSKQKIWIGTSNNGISVIYPDGKKIPITSEGTPGSTLSNNNIRCFEEEQNGSIWVGTYNGITVINPQSMACSYLEHNGLSDYSLHHNSVYAIYKDRQGTMWVGTYYGGVSYTSPTTELYNFYQADNNKKDKLQGFIIGKMTDDDKGNLYIGTEGGGINILDQKKHTIENHRFDPAVMPHNTIKSVWFDKEQNRLFIGTFKDGLMSYDQQTRKLYPIKSSLLQSTEQQIIQELVPYKQYLILLTQQGIYKADRNTLQVSYLFDSVDIRNLCTDMIRTIYIDQQDRLWVSSVRNGLFSVHLPTNKIQWYPFTDKAGSIGKSPVISICANDNDDLFLATAGTGIYRYNRQTDNFTTFREGKNILLSDICYSLAFTRSGKLLITSDKGITLFDTEKENSRHIQLGKNFPLKALTASCGLYVSSSTGEIFIGGMYGMVSFFEKDMWVKNDNYTMYFSSLSVNNRTANPQTTPEILSQSISYSDKINLKHDQNSISITFATSNYASSGYSKYEYKMEGLDSYWVETPFNTVTYSSLPTGNYLFTVRETGNANKSASIKVHVTPPLYASTPAYILYLLLAVTLLWWLIRINKSKILLKASLEMEHKEKLHIEELNQNKLRFFTNISHEFRTPLTLITSQLDTFFTSENLSPANRNKIQRIKKHTLRMQELITELLDFRKQENGKLTIKASKQNINTFLADIYSSFIEYAQSKHIRYHFNHTEEVINVWFDPAQLQKVFYNLLSNAFKFTEPEGEITLSLKQKNGYILIKVTNIGSEIKQEDIDKIFDRFYQADNLSISAGLPGSGIGLALSKGIILSHKGHISVSSENKCTTFEINLPLGEGHLKPEEKCELSTNPSPAYKPLIEPDSRTENDDAPFTDDPPYSILFVEDNEELLQLLKDSFSPIYRVFEAHNGEEGLRLAREYTPNIIVSDVMMPHLSGTDMCQQLKKHIETSHIPIILLTAQSSVEQNMVGLKHGADDYITKPFSIELLLLKCNNIVKTQQELQRKFCNNPQIEIAELATNGLDQELLTKSVHIIEANLDNPLFDITLWSREMGIGRTRLYNKIKSITGLTPNDFIINIKLKKAAVMLSSQNDLTIAEIAYHLGFSSPGYFGKCFKNQFDVTPLQYKKNSTDHPI